MECKSKMEEQKRFLGFLYSARKAIRDAGFSLGVDDAAATFCYARSGSFSIWSAWRHYCKENS